MGGVSGGVMGAGGGGEVSFLNGGTKETSSS